MITPAILDEIAERLAKGWVIRREQIEALVTMCRSHPALPPPKPKKLCKFCDRGRPCTISNCPNHPMLSPYIP